MQQERTRPQQEVQHRVKHEVPQLALDEPVSSLQDRLGALHHLLLLIPTERNDAHRPSCSGVNHAAASRRNNALPPNSRIDPVLPQRVRVAHHGVPRRDGNVVGLVRHGRALDVPRLGRIDGEDADAVRHLLVQARVDLVPDRGAPARAVDARHAVRGREGLVEGVARDGTAARGGFYDGRAAVGQWDVDDGLGAARVQVGDGFAAEHGWGFALFGEEGAVAVGVGEVGAGGGDEDCRGGGNGRGNGAAAGGVGGVDGGELAAFVGHTFEFAEIVGVELLVFGGDGGDGGDLGGGHVGLTLFVYGCGLLRHGLLLVDVSIVGGQFVGLLFDDSLFQLALGWHVWLELCQLLLVTLYSYADDDREDDNGNGDDISGDPAEGEAIPERSDR